ncbi:hypothetical protein ACMHYB_50475 [Sorangium sp. So ce1128]
MTPKQNPATYDLDDLRRQFIELGIEKNVIDRTLESIGNVVALESAPVDENAPYMFPARVRIEIANGNSAFPLAVYIVNLEARVVRVSYERVVEIVGAQISRSSATLQPYERRYIGDHCETGDYMRLCRAQISTRILSAEASISGG